MQKLHILYWCFLSKSVDKQATMVPDENVSDFQYIQSFSQIQYEIFRIFMMMMTLIITLSFYMATNLSTLFQ